MSRTILLAGANSGMGLATARILSESGAQIISAGRHHDQVEDFSGVSTVSFDATEKEASIDLPDELNGLVYFPGTITLKPLNGLREEDFQRDFEINLLGALRLIRAALPALKKVESASIVLFSTVAVGTGLPYHASVAAAKGAVEGFARSIAAELAPAIRVNCIAPSLTDTPLAAGLLDSERKIETASKRHPLQRVGKPEEIAELVQFLLGDGSRFMTGQILRPDGGMSALRGL